MLELGHLARKSPQGGSHVGKGTPLPALFDTMAPTFIGAQRAVECADAQFALFLPAAGRRRNRRQASPALDGPKDDFFERLVACENGCDNRAAIVPGTQRHPMVGRPVEEIGRGKGGLQVHMIPAYGHRASPGAKCHQGHGQMQRIGREAKMLGRFDVDLRRAAAPAQIFHAGQQALLQRPEDAHHRAFAGAGPIDRRFDRAAFETQPHMSLAAPKDKLARIADRLVDSQAGGLLSHLHQWAEDGQQSAVALDAHHTSVRCGPEFESFAGPLYPRLGRVGMENEHRLFKGPEARHFSA